jgi:hypothetical protein
MEGLESKVFRESKCNGVKIFYSSRKKVSGRLSTMNSFRRYHAPSQ